MKQKNQLWPHYLVYSFLVWGQKPLLTGYMPGATTFGVQSSMANVHSETIEVKPNNYIFATICKN